MPVVLGVVRKHIDLPCHAEVDGQLVFLRRILPAAGFQHPVLFDQAGQFTGHLLRPDLQLREKLSGFPVKVHHHTVLVHDHHAFRHAVDDKVPRQLLGAGHIVAEEGEKQKNGGQGITHGCNVIAGYDLQHLHHKEYTVGEYGYDDIDQLSAPSGVVLPAQEDKQVCQTDDDIGTYQNVMEMVPDPVSVDQMGKEPFVHKGVG